MGKLFNTTGHLDNGSSNADGVPRIRSQNAFQSNSTFSSHDEATTAPNNNGSNTANTTFKPIAICGMGCRLPGGLHSPTQLWDFLVSKGDAKCRVPETRYNLKGFYSRDKKPASTTTEYGYFLDQSVDLGALDTSFFSMGHREVEHLDPQQRILLEVARESMDDAGEVNWKGANIGVYVGSYGNDWADIFTRDTQQYGTYQVMPVQDFSLSNRVSYEMDLCGPSMTIRTACSSGLVALNEACAAIAKGDCKSAIVGGTSLLMSPLLTSALVAQGVLSVDGSCNTFSSNVNGYARAEGIVSMYLKPLEDAIRDGNPVRAVIMGSATNADGKTPGFSVPSTEMQEKLIRHTYNVAGIPQAEVTKTGWFHCHGTGTPIGDPIETAAVANIFGKHVGGDGIYIGSVKPNLGHGEGVSGLTSVLVSVLALENRAIPPSIKCLPLNPNIPFEKANLMVTTEVLPWPEGRQERVSVNSFGVGGANAHVILDSAANATIAGLRCSSTSPSVHSKSANDAEAPQLLVYSANNPISLKEMTASYHKFLENAPDSLNLGDVAYTLATRREHLPHRSFSVGTKSLLSSAALPAASSKQAPSIVMVFTGQGAQWPQMGRELIRANPVFRNSIKALDKHLQHQLGPGQVAPSWTIEEELSKPTRTSRVNEAEFSQPLCTAVQIALVDTYASIGIKPAVVVGHSSGEIAGAYAAGALTAREAISVAFHRGLVTTTQTRQGAMAAISLGWDEIETYLVPGVIRACDNSPNSVTLSGDAEPLQKVVAAIKETNPGILATVLKVEKAYHSHHMVEVGSEYHRRMTASNVVGRTPSDVRFFSSVSGKLLSETRNINNEQPLGPRYWQENLESPVLFKSAVSSILRDSTISNPVFLEVGPHGALAGPLRQIMAQESSTAQHISTLVRKQDGVISFLTSVGKLWCMHAVVDFSALIPHGTCIPNLPRYAWNHHRSYWFESRVAKEWRFREHPYHDLLGARVPESSEIDPVWRNLFHLDNAPWVRDHKIRDDIVFPFSGYVAMAAEGARQIGGLQESTELRHVVVSTALVIRTEVPTELVTSFRRHRLTDSADSQWWEFSIASHNGHAWTKHCSGEVRASSRRSWGNDELPDAHQTPRSVMSRKWYDRVRRAGLDYGHHFTTLENILTSTRGAQLARSEIQNNWHGDEDCYHLHPVIVDSYLQLLGAAAHYGLTHDYHQSLPISAEYLAFSRSDAPELTLFASAERDGDRVLGQGFCTDLASSTTVLKVSGVRMAPLESSRISSLSKEPVPITARCEWVPHFDFATASSLIQPAFDDTNLASQLDTLGKLGIAVSKQALISVSEEVQTTSLPHLEKYRAWLSGYDAFDAKGSAQPSKIDSLVAQLSGTPVERVAIAISTVAKNAAAIISGKKNAREILNADNILNNLDTFLKEYDASSLFQCLGHSKPNLRVLELGCGFGVSTQRILEQLARKDGQALYMRYVCTDENAGMVNSAKERLQALHGRHLEFITLDIGSDPTDQGFEEGQFDLVIASAVLHNTARRGESLRNIRRLLSPDGRLLLQQPRHGMVWTKFVLGTLPRWWQGSADEASEEPFLPIGKLKQELVAAGFQEPREDDIVQWSSPSAEMSNIMLVKPVQEHTRPKSVSLLLDNECGNDTCSSSLKAELESRGYKVTRCSLSNYPQEKQDIIALVDMGNSPFFEDIKAPSFGGFQKLVDYLSRSGSGILWVTQPSQMHCSDPRFAPIIGCARTIRNELGVDFATCEVDQAQFGTPSIAKEVANVFSRFNQRNDKDGMGPDYEFVINDGKTRVNRFFPFSLHQEMQVDEHSSEACLDIGQAGRLDLLRWASRSPPPAPQEDEVEVEMYATGLNFKDVLVAAGIIQLGTPTIEFGFEGAGVVRRIGPSVKDVRVGDRVALFGCGLFSTYATIPENHCEKLPDNLSFEDGASMPVTYLTVIYSLINIGKLEKNQTVLIHSGCGGVGLAALQIAQMIGAEVFTTVSSEAKINYLVETCGIPRSHIFNSRDASFVDGVSRETGGKGVDLVLNSLSGELLHATWSCVAKLGMMVEIGKRDLVGSAKLDMAPFLHNRSYSCVDIVQVWECKPLVAKRLLQDMMAFIRQGLIKPIRLDKVYEAAAVQEAFQYMQEAGHIGKIVVSLRNHTTGKPTVGEVAISHQASVQLDPSASYLLIGGLGGLGRSIAVWLVQHGARNLTFLSRSAGSRAQDADFARELESLDCTVQFVRGSVTDATDVARAVDGCLAPLKGIIQMSMVLRDKTFSKMSLQDWEEATQPKIKGTWNLHDATCDRGTKLDFLVLFSSLSGVIGQVGQANYAAANSFLDAFTQFRASKGLPCTTIDIGAMEGAGYLFENQDLLKKMQGSGWRSVTEDKLLEALGAAISSSSAAPASDMDSSLNKANVFVDKTNMLLGILPSIPLSNPDSSARLRNDVRMSIYHNIGATGTGDTGSESSEDSLPKFLSRAKANPEILRDPGTAAVLGQEFGKRLMTLLLRPSEEPDLNSHLTSIGLDSMVAVEMRAWWKAILGLDMSVLDMLAMGTLEAIGKRAAKELVDVYCA